MKTTLTLGIAAGLVVATLPLQAQVMSDGYQGDNGRDRGASCFSGNDDDGDHGSRGRQGLGLIDLGPILGGGDDDDGRRLNVVGLTSDQRLICFSEDKPDEARDIGTVSGLQGDTALVGIDFRVQDGNLYGVGNQGGVYKFEADSAVPVLVNRLTVALDGASFGVDFNPPADRLRVTSDKGQNLRHNVNAGGTTLVDDPLDYPPGAQLNSVGPNALGIAGSAYTNNDLADATATTLYALDSILDQVAIQSPPNDGTLAATGKLTVDTTAQVGFDIYSTVRDGVTVGVRALASLSTADGYSGFYSVRLSTGNATSRGNFATKNQVIGIAVPLNQL